MNRASWPRTALGAAVLFLMVVVAMALFPGLFTALDPLATDTSAVLQAPGWGHPFGTDQTGRDIYARVVYGASFSLGTGFGATAAALSVGVVVGTLVGLAPKAVDGVLMRGVEIVLAFPEFLIALFAIAVLGPGPVNVGVAVGIAAVPAYIRVARAETLVVRRAGYVEAARGLGIHPLRVAVTHVVPNILRPLGVIATIGIGTTIVAAAGLSFLGLGPQDPTPEWGLILSGGRNLLAQAWWVAFFPGLFITGTVIAATAVGRRLRRAGEGRSA
ncbi:ABC transporter permease [Agreia sp. COWG]|uniref:ABC transporter permease n=1 Tax=Agreia sp. COWG TaxID=2773266 RepID=UPI001926968F|nr:ABC transporter permease [Agreia sp. COWG]CAD5996265.1 Peptide ABC transporter permease [Agreia sp. COWG]